jgi:hypothetical protein
MLANVILIVVRPVNFFFISTVLLMVKTSVLFLRWLQVFLLQLLDSALTAEEIGWQLI